jgi:serine/threonine protein kinase
MEAQFCTEVKLLYQLDHPNIVKLYGHFSDDYHVFLLMEYVEGGQLLAKLNSHESYVAKVMEPLLEVVEHLHSQ